MLQDRDLLLLQLDIRQKSKQRVSEILNRKNHSEELWKHIWTIAVKI